VVIANQAEGPRVRVESVLLGVGLALFIYLIFGIGLNLPVKAFVGF
jgi:hypothetical protein